MFRRSFLISAAVLFFSTASAKAAGTYTLVRQDASSSPLTLVQGKEYAFQLISNPPMFENIRITDDASLLADYTIRVGQGVQTGANTYKPDGTGKLSFFVRFNKAPGNVLLTFANTADPVNINTTVSFTIQRYPTSFKITPPNPTVDVNVPFDIDVIAVDAFNNWISAFDEPIQITDLQRGDLFTVTAASFVAGNGKATVPITLIAGNMNNQNKLQVVSVGNPYIVNAVAVPQPTYTSPNFINVNPGPYKKIVMLFPGEVLNPGFGKNSVGIATQTAGTNVSEVTIWRVDQYYNPILASVPTTITFTSSNPSDTISPYKMPDPRNMVVPPLKILGAAADPFKFPSNGNRTIKATPDGNDAEADTSNVPVNPGSVFSYIFEVQPPAGTVTTDDVIQVKIKAFDGSNQVMTTLNGVFLNAHISAKTASEDRVEWVDTNAATDQPDNVVSFNAGVATVNLTVTKRASNVQLHFTDPFGIGVLSNLFNVDRGVANRVLLTVVGKVGANPLVGETYDAGTYPGNRGTPPQVKAGDQLIVEARVTDRRFNLFADISINNLPVSLQSHATTYLTSSHPLDPQPKFDSTGLLTYDSNVNFDSSFRVRFRTAGVQQRIQAVSPIGAGSFFSSTISVAPDAYSKLILQVPGETLRPGTTVYASGKEGTPLPQSAGVAFDTTLYATDQFFNPIAAGPYPQVNFSIAPDLASNFVSGTLPAQMFSSAKTFSVTLSSSSDVRVNDVATASINQTVPVVIGAGPLDHFSFVLSNAGVAKEAGVPFQVTIQALDQYENVLPGFTQPVTLQSNMGPLTMSPETVNLVGGVATVNLTMFAATSTARVNIRYNTTSSTSPAFVVNHNAAGFTKLLLLGAQEVYKPGRVDLGGKTGTNSTTILVGTDVNVTIYATDDYYNIVPSVIGQSVKFTSDKVAAFTNGQINGGVLQTTLRLFQSGLHTTTVDEDGGPNVATSSSAFTAVPDAFSKILVLAPGEVYAPGNAPLNGKISLNIATQTVSVPFQVRVLAVDKYYNTVAKNDGNVELITDTPNVFFLPANDTSNNIPNLFANGENVRQVMYTDPTLPGQTYLLKGRDRNAPQIFQPADLVGSAISVRPGAHYVIRTPANIIAGQAFTAEVTLEDNGAVLTGTPDQEILLMPLSSSATAASGSFKADGSPLKANLIQGRAIINNLVYRYVEPIIISVTDSFNRVALSTTTVTVDPVGLIYKVSATPRADLPDFIAGPPKTFNLKIQLYESIQNTPVKDIRFNHQAKISVFNEFDVQRPTSTFSQSSVGLDNPSGGENLSFWYSIAETIRIRVENLNSPVAVSTGTSNTITLKPDAYQKLVLVAPSGTLKKGQDADFNVLAVDQNGNTDSSYNAGQIVFSAPGDTSISNSNPANQGSPMVAGTLTATIHFNSPGTKTLIATDQATGRTASVNVVVDGSLFTFDTPLAPISGSDFPMEIKVLLAGSTSTVVDVSLPFILEARDAADSTKLAHARLFIDNGNFVHGKAPIVNQKYPVAEDIKIYIKDSQGNEGLSNTIHLVPDKVYYEATLPSSVEAGSPFTLNVKTKQDRINTDVYNHTRDLKLIWNSNGVVISSPSLLPESLPVINGVGALANLRYPIGGSLYATVIDTNSASNPFNLPPYPTTDSGYGSNVMTIKPGPLADIRGMTDFTMLALPSAATTYVVVGYDENGNKSEQSQLKFEISGLTQGELSMNGSYPVLLANSNSGIRFTPSEDANGVATLLISDALHPDAAKLLVKITILGFPNTAPRAPQIGGNRFIIGEPVFLPLPDMNVKNGGTVKTFYKVDNSTGYAAYDPNVGITGLNETRQYKIDWYSQICYDSTCSNPVSQLDINGGPQSDIWQAALNAGKLSSYPNPFNPKKGGYAHFQYTLDGLSSVDFDIYDLFGQKVRHWSVEAGQDGGKSGLNDAVIWDGKNDDGTVVANGGYILVVKAGATGQEMKTKILVVK